MIIDPADQFQIGDEVIYVPEGIYTKVTGYSWSVKHYCDSKLQPQEILGYELNCGITVSRDALARIPDQPPPPSLEQMLQNRGRPPAKPLAVTPEMVDRAIDALGDVRMDVLDDWKNRRFINITVGIETMTKVLEAALEVPTQKVAGWRHIEVEVTEEMVEAAFSAVSDDMGWLAEDDGELVNRYFDVLRKALHAALDKATVLSVTPDTKVK